MEIKTKDIFSKLKKDKKLFILLIIAFTAIIFLIITEIAGGDSNDKVTKKDETTLSTYEKKLSIELENIISKIEGAGETKVMVTLDTGEENVYARQGKSSSEQTNEKDKFEDEYEYIVIKKNSSNQEGLLLKVIQPNIRGVAIVCDGADSSIVKESILNTVTAVLDIKSNKVSISKMKID